MGAVGIENAVQGSLHTWLNGSRHSNVPCLQCSQAQPSSGTNILSYISLSTGTVLDLQDFTTG